MDELLTTGELVDRLKSGESAEVVSDPNGMLKGHKITNNGNQFLWESDSIIFSINDATVKLKWRILPKPIEYVSFEEAKKALQHKGVVNCYWNGYKHTYSNKNDLYLTIEGHDRPTWVEIFYGKWEIVE